MRPASVSPSTSSVSTCTPSACSKFTQSARLNSRQGDVIIQRHLIMLDISSHDIVIVGGGGAGLRAAIAIAETDPQLSVAVVSKVYPMRSHTVAAEGGAAGVRLHDDSLDEHAHDTVSGGDWLCDQDAVEAFVKEAPLELMRLEHWGCPWSREPDGRIAVRPFGGMKKTRTWFAADETGFHLLHTLFQTSLKYDSVTRYDEYFVTTLLVDDGRVQGVVAIELTTGKVQAITAKAVILCTGGCGRIFRYTTNAAIKTGDGMALAYRAVDGILGTYIVGRLAPRRPLAHALVLGGIGIVLSSIGLFATMGSDGAYGPLWYPLSLMVVAPVSALIGGQLAEAHRVRPSVALTA